MSNSQNISFDSNIILNNKVKAFNCCKVGNFICGSFQIYENESFTPGEKLVSFPFKSKVAMRFVTGINQVQYMIDTLGNDIKYIYVNGGQIKVYDNFPFFFII